MSAKRVVGIVLIVVGIMALVWGGVFLTDRDTIVDAGPLEIQTQDREGFSLPPVVGVIALVAGLVLVAMPSRHRA